MFLRGSGWPRGLISAVLSGSGVPVWIYGLQQVWCMWVASFSSVAVSGVELGHEFSVSGAGCFEVLGTFLELQLEVDDLLFEADDLLVELVDVSGGSKSRFAPGLLAE